MASPGKLRSDKWPGAFKLAEECSEVSHVLMKLMGGCEDPALVEHLEDEIADVYAAIGFFLDFNRLDFGRIDERAVMKKQRWTDKREGVKTHG